MKSLITSHYKTLNRDSLMCLEFYHFKIKQIQQERTIVKTD